MKRSTLVRLVGRIGVVSVAVAFLSIVGIQYARVIGRNVALAHELRDAQSDLVRLKARRAQQAREIRRLSDPRGAIPEIHAKLHLVGDNEAIIYLKRAGASP